MKNKRKPMPSLDSDADAQAFVSQADLSEYDLSGFKPMRFEIEPKAGALDMRLPVSLRLFIIKGGQGYSLNLFLRRNRFNGGNTDVPSRFYPRPASPPLDIDQWWLPN